MKAFDEPSPSDWDRWIARLLDGEEPSEAARAERQTCSAFRRQDPGRHGEALQMSREIRAGADRDLVRNKLRTVVGDTGHPQWAKGAELLAKHAGMFDETQRVEITGDGGGPVEVTVDHDSESVRRILDKLVSVGLVRPGPAAAADAETVELLPARTD